MITNLELSEPVQILNMKHTCTPSKGNDFFMRLFYRQRWERTKFKLIVSAQDYEILNWTKLDFSFHCLTTMLWGPPILLATRHQYLLLQQESIWGNDLSTHFQFKNVWCYIPITL